MNKVKWYFKQRKAKKVCRLIAESGEGFLDQRKAWYTQRVFTMELFNGVGWSAATCIASMVRSGTDHRCIVPFLRYMEK